MSDKLKLTVNVVYSSGLEKTYFTDSCDEEAVQDMIDSVYVALRDETPCILRIGSTFIRVSHVSCVSFTSE